MPEGMKITLAGLGGGLTRDENGATLLPVPFVFQCPPLEEFKVQHAFSMGNYDTIQEGQFSRRGSRQLATWQFDTLVMEVGVKAVGLAGQQQLQAGAARRNAHGRHVPGWVPFPNWDAPGVPTALGWWVDQLQRVHDAGAPFRFTAHFQTTVGVLRESAAALGPVVSMPAVLLGFTEGHKHGESDAIYLEGVSFGEWRDPTVKQRRLGQGTGHPSDAPPTTVILRQDGRCVTHLHHVIPRQNRHATLADLSKYFYHSPSYWRDIANANKIKGGGANQPLVKFPKYHKIPKHGVTIKVPASRGELLSAGSALLGAGRL